MRARRAAGAATVLVSALALATACADHPLAADSTRTRDSLAVTVAAPGGIVQAVEIAPRSPRAGDTLVLRSRVRNEGSEPVTVEVRLCGLDVRAVEWLTDPFIRCEGYSAMAVLAPGHSIVETDRRIVVGEHPERTLATEVRRFDLSPLRAAYREAYSAASGTIVLNLRSFRIPYRF